MLSDRLFDNIFKVENLIGKVDLSSIQPGYFQKSVDNVGELACLFFDDRDAFKLPLFELWSNVCSFAQ